MNLAIRAALYNALLLPGWGHLYLKKYKRGAMFILPVLAGVLSICWVVQKHYHFRRSTISFSSGLIAPAATYSI